MPPTKEKLSQKDFRDKVHEHGIRFEGPTRPTQWPDEHKHIFKIIRELQFLRYEEYRENHQISSRRRSEYQKRVRNVRDKVRDLLEDVNPHEDSWRELEGPIFEKFDRPVICGKCNKELSKLDYEANCFTKESQIKLDAKRKKRKLCTCGSKRSREETEDHDEEHGVIFCSVEEAPITHASGDKLDKFSIPMQPDKVIGLRAPPYIARNELHFPVRGRDKLLLPFLVIEAKKEKDAPGFRSIQYQTAFPVRRFLKAQAEIDSRDSSCEPCLVWFFAYQGDQWRLYAGTLDCNKSRVYDLWQGMIQSRDGALQLLLIVDYIWSWARDVYRPAIRELISSSTTSFRDISPVSVDRFRHSVSLCPTTSSAPASQESDQMQIDEIVVSRDEPQQHHSDAAKVFPDASSHPFLQWAVGHVNSPSWTSLGSIRHSNIVQFEFQCYNCSLHAGSTEGDLMEDSLSLYMALHSHAVTTSTEQLDDVAFSWTRGLPPTSRLELAGDMRVTFFFQTYCDKPSWQIKRVLSCIIWETEKLPIPEWYETEDIARVISQVRNISGRDSVSLALKKTGLVLRHKRDGSGLEWKSFTQAHLPETAFDTLRELGAGICYRYMVLRRVKLCNGLLWVVTGSDIERQYAPVAWEQDTRTGDSMFAIYPSSWLDNWPKFCLFTLPNADCESSSDLHRLLEEAIMTKSFYGDIGYRWTKEDWGILGQWRQALVSEKTIVA